MGRLVVTNTAGNVIRVEYTNTPPQKNTNRVIFSPVGIELSGKNVIILALFDPSVDPPITAIDELQHTLRCRGFTDPEITLSPYKFTIRVIVRAGTLFTLRAYATSFAKIIETTLYISVGIEELGDTDAELSLLA